MTIPVALIERYCQVMCPERSAGRWHRQSHYPGPFRPGTRALTMNDVRSVLKQRLHVAVRSRDDGMTEYVAFDIDCRTITDLPRRDAHYLAIRHIMGLERQPLVYATPSGRGLRVLYRVPEMRLDRLVTGRDTGLVADVLRGANLPVRDGEIEIFPQLKKVDRLPLGRNMPLLNPATLEPLPHAAIGATVDVIALEGALRELEAWSAAPLEDLVPYLESLPGEPPVRVAHSTSAPVSADFVRVGSAIKPSHITRALVTRGLSSRSSRYAAEWLVGIAILLAPELFEDLGAHQHMSDEAIAGTLAGWLSERHNGYSNEWDAAVRTQASVARAIDTWTARYLACSGTSGDNLISRLRRASAALDGSLRRTLLLQDDERRSVLQLVEDAGLRGSKRYRAEVWLAASLRSVKRIVKYHTRNGNPPRQREENGQGMTIVQIAARWMQKWPYGKGASRHVDGPTATAYLCYRDLLMSAGWMSLERYSSVAAAFKRGSHPPDDLAREANTYAVRTPNFDVRVRDVGVDALRLQAVLIGDELQMNGRRVGLDEAHHILWLTRNAMAVRTLYGYRLGVRIAAIASELERRLASPSERVEPSELGPPN